MARENTRDEHETYHEAQGTAYNGEHTAAYIMAIAAIVLGVLGLLTAFQIVELRDYGATASFEQAGETGTQPETEEGTQGTANVAGAESTSSDSFWDGLMLLTVATAAGMLSLALHRNDHHRKRDPRTVSDTDTGFWSGEHAAAYVLAFGTIVVGTVAILTGFDAFGTDTDQRDGTIWAFAALLGSILTNTAHTVRHHQTVAEEDHLVRVVRQRVGTREPERTGAIETEQARNRTR